MKFMKLGSKPDIFTKQGDTVHVATDLSSDILFCVEDIKFQLHKFPLLSKCGLLQRLVAGACNKGCKESKIEGIPGGAEAFEICAKFCYGITITLNAFNVASVRCAAEYLEMTEVIEKGNLIFKLEVFLNSSILQSWKDCIIILQSTKLLLPWSSDLELVSRCIESVASKASADLSKVDWSFTYTRAGSSNSQLSTDYISPPWNGIQSHRHCSTPKDWWMEDISELEIDVYSRIILALKSKGRMSDDLIGEALRIYACKWLPGLSKDQNIVETVRAGFGHLPNDYIEIATKHKMLLETIVNLLPTEKRSCSCSFLLKLLKAATILGTARMELARRVGLQLEEASLNDLLIPSLSYANDSLYDVDLVQYILEQFIMQDQSPDRAQQPPETQNSPSVAEHLDFLKGRNLTSTHSSKLRVAKLLDGYLAEIARDTHLPLAKFTALAEAIPNSARPVHDGIYRAIDIYLKEHPGLTKIERKKICRILDCKKLSMDACMHAAQNERLPLRVVVQVLFFEQIRTAMTGGFLLNDLPSNIKALMSQQEGLHEETQLEKQEDNWESVHHDFNLLKGDLTNMKQRLAEAERERTNMQQQILRHSKSKFLLSFPAKSKEILSKIWPLRILSGSKTSHNSRTEQSTNHTDVKQNASRRRRHSVS